MRMRAPMMSIHTVAAGGGSILHFDGARFRVGPDSAGANPGPKCYRRGGPLAVTDANVMVGQADPRFLSQNLRPAAGSAARRGARARRPSRRWPREVGDGRGAEEVADGFIAIAVAKMAEAIKKISVARGYDVTRYALNCFGGAGGQHACDVADALAIKTVLIHPLSSLLSAYGMGLADIRAHRGQGGRGAAQRRGAAARSRALVGKTRRARRRARSPRRASTRCGDRHAPARAVALRRLRHGARGRLGATAAAMRRAFEKRAQARFGFIDRDKALVIEAVDCRGDRRRREIRRAPRGEPTATARREPERADAILLRRRLARGAASSCARISRSARGSTAPR